MKKYKLSDLFIDHRLYHEEIQQDNFIVARAGITDYGKYKQALRELHKRYRGLKQIEIEKKKNELKIRRYTILGIVFFFIPMIRIKLAECKMAHEEIKFNISETQREFDRFYTLACTYKEKTGELTPEKRNQYENEYWKTYLKRQLAIEYIAYGNPTNVTLELIGSAPTAMKRELLAWMRQPTTDMEMEDLNIKNLISWYNGIEADEIKSNYMIENKEINKLIQE
jgi:hypothetical protein